MSITLFNLVAIMIIVVPLGEPGILCSFKICFLYADAINLQKTDILYSILGSGNNIIKRQYSKIIRGC